MVRMVEKEILLKRGVALGVSARGVLFDQFRDDSAGSGINMLRSGGTRSLGVELVHIDGFALRTAFDDAVALIVVLIGLSLAVVGNTFYAVFFVPDDGPVGAVGVLGPTGLVAV